MSAGVHPEGFDQYMEQVKEGALSVTQALHEVDQRVWIPSLIMAMVSIGRAHADESNGEMQFEDMVLLMHGGIDALARDMMREMSNGN